ncbi:MAG: PEGA domain-containing protein [Nanoarchaeota archaeon]
MSLVLTSILIINGNFKTGQVVGGQGSILADSNPDRANILIDGANQGFTSKTVPVSVGTHDVVISKTGYLDYSTTINVASGEIVRVNTNLATDPNYWDSTQYGSVTVMSNPPMSNVFIDDVYKGVTPITIRNVSPGTHGIRVSKAGYTDYINTIYTYTQRDNSFNINLVP